MVSSARTITALVSVHLLAVAVTTACTGEPGPSLSSTAESDGGIPTVPVPAADGPKLGSTANRTLIVDRPNAKARQLGYLHAGGRVARSEKPYGTDGCPGGWYPVRPRGFVCVDRGATIDMKHPTLLAMAIQPELEKPLPYAYARTVRATARLERDARRDIAVREVAKLPRKSLMAIVGSWSANDDSGARQRLGMMTNGQFVRAEDLEAAEPSAFTGLELGEKTKLPVAFVVKRGVVTWKLDDADPQKLDELGYHEKVQLTGRFRSIGPIKYWALEDGRWVRHRDVTVVRQRNVFPEFASEDQKWIDVSVVTGTLVIYEGKRPLFATLVSVGRDRLDDPKTTASTARGEFEVIGKQITVVDYDPKRVSDGSEIHDLPWAIELNSGQLIHGAYWHDRFGIEHSLGNVELAPADAARVWHWVDPALPDGWHGTGAAPGKRTQIIIRK
jgi:hypothetical protein